MVLSALHDAADAVVALPAPGLAAPDHGLGLPLLGKVSAPRELTPTTGEPLAPRCSPWVVRGAGWSVTVERAPH